jgi:hypothetical protein
MDDCDAPALNRDNATERQIAQGSVVIPPHRLDWSDTGERREGLLRVHVSGVDDEVDASKHLEQPIRDAVEELRAVGIRDHADARRHVDQLSSKERAASFMS